MTLVLTFRCETYGLCVRTRREYDIARDTWLGPMMVLRLGDFAWSTKRGFFRVSKLLKSPTP